MYVCLNPQMGLRGCRRHKNVLLHLCQEPSGSSHVLIFPASLTLQVKTRSGQLPFGVAVAAHADSAMLEWLDPAMPLEMLVHMAEDSGDRSGVI